MSGLTMADALRELGARKRLIVPVAAIAVLAALLVAGRGYTVERAATDILVDTPRSQAVDIGTRGEEAAAVPQIDTLATRARLLGNLMASGSIERAVAERAGVDPGRLIVVPPPDTEAAATSAAAPDNAEVTEPEAIVLTVTTDSTLPILHVIAQAPQASTAERLASGAVAELKAYLGSVAATDEIPEAQRLHVSEIGAQRAVSVARGPGPLAAIVVGLMILVAGCAVLVMLPRWVRDRRRGGVEDASGEANGNGRVHPPEAASQNGTGRTPSLPPATAGE